VVQILSPQHFKFPLEKLQCNSLWGGLGEEFKYHFVRWFTVCTPISKGGLGIRNLLRFNCAILGKWLWCYELEREAGWRVVVDAKYGSSWGGWCSREPVGAYEVELWKNILRDWGKFSSHIRFDEEDGSKIRFWHDLWYEDMALKEAFLGLFGIASPKDAFVAAHIDIPGGSFQWSVSFVRTAHDKLWWVTSKRGLFGVKSVTMMICNDSFCFLWKNGELRFH